MKNRSYADLGLYMPLLALLLTTACKKDATSKSSDQTDNNAPAASLSDSSTTADNAYMDATTNAFYGYRDNVPSASNSRHGSSVTTMGTTTNTPEHLSCAAVTTVTTNGGFPITLTLDFGSGCTSGADSILRTGKVTYIYSGNIIAAGTTVSATFDHYTVNGYGLSGSYLLTNASTHDGDSVTIFQTRIQNGAFTFPDGTSFSYSGNKTYSTTSGTTVPYTFLYDSLSITGGNQFASSTGNSLTTTITTPLVKTLLCHNISSGVFSFVYNGKISGTVDYGNGDCDAEATVKIGLFTQTINLH